MNEKSTGNKVIINLIWRLLERAGVQGLQFVIGIILARVLFPDDYGVIALINAFVLIAVILVQNGFHTALIQKKEADDTDISSVFYINLMLAATLYTLLYFTSPFIAKYLDQPLFVPVIRVLSVILFFGAVNSIQVVILSKNMQFKKFFLGSIGGSVVSGALGIYMAYSGYGVWALVWQQISSQFINIVILGVMIKWKPKLVFSFNRLKNLFSYGWKLLSASLLDGVYHNMYSIVIGKIFNSQTLGLYNRGEQFPKIIVTNVNVSLQSVMLPAMCAEQDDIEKIKAMIRRSVITGSFIVFPLMIGMAAAARPLITALLTEKWIAAVPFLQIMCITYALMPVHSVNLQAINAIGRSDIFLKLEIIKKIIGISVLCISIPFGIYVMVGLQPVMSVISIVINAYPNKKFFGYGFKEQLNDFLPTLIISFIMGGFIYLLSFPNWNPWLTLIIQAGSGIAVYSGLAFIFKFESLNYIANTVKSMFGKTG